MSETISLGRRGRPPRVRVGEDGVFTVPVKGAAWTFAVKNDRITPVGATNRMRKGEPNGEADFAYAKAVLERYLG